MAPERAQAKALEAVATRRQPSPAAVEDTPEAAIVTAVDTLAATVAVADIPEATVAVADIPEAADTLVAAEIVVAADTLAVVAQQAAETPVAVLKAVVELPYRNKTG